MRALLYCPSLCMHTCAEAESQPGTDDIPLPSFPHWIWVGVFKGYLVPMSVSSFVHLLFPHVVLSFLLFTPL